MISPAFVLEVMDKEADLRVVWLVFIVIGIAGFRAAQAKRWAFALVLVLWGFATWTAIGDLFDPQVRPAIVAEAGRGHVVQLIVASILSLSSIIAGFVYRKRAA